MDKDGQRRTIEFWNIVYLQDITCHSLHQEIISQKVKPPQQIKELWQNLKEQTSPMTRQNSDVKNRIFCLRPYLFSFTSRSPLVRSSFVSRCSLVRYSLVYRRPIEDRTRNKQKTNERTTRKQRKNNEKLSRSDQNPPNYWRKTEKGNSLDDKQ